jgi:uncharacterized protein (DUF1778 family)|nr:hypothetical protein [Sulfurospirillum sp. 'SP']
MHNEKMTESIHKRLSDNRKNLLHVMDGILNKTLTTHDLQEACKVSDKVLEDVKEDIKKLGNS